MENTGYIKDLDCTKDTPVIYGHEDAPIYGQGIRIKPMQAVLEAMKSITNKTIPVEVYSDSNYVVETMNGHFAMKKNRDLWRKLMRERQRFTSIRFIWVKGHDKNQHNNDVDRQAVAESRKILEAQENGQV